ncbi:type II toxin-antitoxin system VapC family toxin [Propioniciclava tarda]|uniref:Ribonuclease VapC n=1 Tax=Propioniciclava tarda TaxID=433330 RepID=A0A4Q9KP34_PROTD|nr:type II toxin-antitoxin system VapC family toxin [Propioniciclava tarda]TBT96254.1 type II toxin-antitoxin system VapC family toxin [Propioniciclava tarda]SMO34361.1 ribonuclease VapC [Propioniciclava tarda]HOA88966.1 type II toxin-antitoxin system VapC family toxin [Propioniciclava tarda]HQA30101.1 type II toxin-antitoxin system VapC family toxin [Propioniciclava tarda]HQD59993.1 type II toxin-antitoxin system VapC family toxin [Propioniciclava tarda]
MIVDTSALVAVILGEPDAERYLDAMAAADELSVSAASLVEALIVVEAKQGPEASDDLQALLAELEARVEPLDESQAILASRAWRRFGKGRHPAGLNLGDTFAYALATATGRPLLYKGADFDATDVAKA